MTSPRKKNWQIGQPLSVKRCCIFCFYCFIKMPHSREILRWVGQTMKLPLFVKLPQIPLTSKKWNTITSAQQTPPRAMFWSFLLAGPHSSFLSEVLWNTLGSIKDIVSANQLMKGIYRHTSGILWVGSQTTAIKWVARIFWFLSTNKSYVYTILSLLSVQ